MWDRYADGYKGFALEYDFRKCIYKYTNINLNVNLFPVIYTDILPDFTLEEGNLYVRECFSKLDVNNVWSYMLDINCPFNQLYFIKHICIKIEKNIVMNVNGVCYIIILKMIMIMFLYLMLNA